MASPGQSSPSARLLKRLMLRTGRGPLRAAWGLLYRVLIRLVSGYLRREDLSAGVYVTRSFAQGDAVYGLSDVDLAVVVGVARQERMRERWQRLCRRLPVLQRTFEVYVHDEEALSEATRSSVLTFDLERADTSSPPGGDFLAAGLGGPEWWVRRRPGLFAPLSDWRLVSGPDRRPRPAPYDAQERRVAAWLELVVWWSYAFFACRGVPGHRSAYVSAKLVTEGARIWLWLVGAANGWQPREQVLESAIRLIPAEEPALRRALEFHRKPTVGSEDSLAELLPAFARLTGRVAQQLIAEVEPVDQILVRLVREGGELALPAGALDGLSPLASGEHSLLPLADWQALAWPGLPDETFAILALDPGDPGTVAAAAEAAAAGPYVALPAGGALIVPGRDWGVQRSVQCAATDPVTFAVAAGKASARFPDVRGWSARDTAERAVAEHRTWLESARGSGAGGAPEWTNPLGTSPLEPLTALGRLFTAARAAFFLGTLDAGEPELALTLETVAARLAHEDGEAVRAVAEEAYGNYRACRADGSQPPARTIAALDEVVRALPQYQR